LAVGSLTQRADCDFRGGRLDWLFSLRRTRAVEGSIHRFIPEPNFANDQTGPAKAVHSASWPVDTEGGELKILKSIDLISYDVRVISVESNYQDRAISNYLLGPRYRLIKIFRDFDELYARGYAENR
jgi:hypothetical protein